MDQLQIDQLKGAIESLLFVSEKPVTLDQLKEVCDGATVSDIQAIVQTIQDEYYQRKSGMVIVEIAGGFQMLSNSTYASYIRSFYKTHRKEKLSRPALETLAIIAYKQPVGRSEVEMIRGVNSDGVTAHLLNKALIKIVGRKEVPGRPFLYGTTKEFLDYFGLKSLQDLPKLEEFPALAAAEISASSPSTEQDSQSENIEPESEVIPMTQTEEATISQESSGQSRVSAFIQEEKSEGNSPAAQTLSAGSEG